MVKCCEEVSLFGSDWKFQADVKLQMDMKTRSTKKLLKIHPTSNNLINILFT